MPGKSRSRKCAIGVSSGSIRPRSPTGKKRGKPFGHLHAREALLARLGVAGEDAEAERKAGDVREGLAGADPERGQDREDLALEALLELGKLVRIEIVDLRDHDPLVRERRPERLLPELRLALGQLEHALADQRQRRARRQPVRRANGKP